MPVTFITAVIKILTFTPTVVEIALRLIATMAVASNEPYLYTETDSKN